MPDALGYRVKFGVLVPSTNTIVEPDFYAMAPPGVTLHVGRIFIENQTMDDDASFEKLMLQIRASIARAVADVMSSEPDALIMGMSSETFWGGKKGNEEFQRRIEELAGLPIATSANDRPAATYRPSCRVGSIAAINIWSTRRFRNCGTALTADGRP